jgi:hypothetical protein
MQEAETKKYWFEPVQDRSFISRLSLVQQKRPLLVSTAPLEALERIAKCLTYLFFPMEASSHVSLLWDALPQRFFPPKRSVGQHPILMPTCWERGGRNAIESDKKSFHRRNAYVAIVSLKKPRGMPKALNSHCTIAVGDRSAPLLSHLLFFTAPPTRGRDPMKIVRRVTRA